MGDGAFIYLSCMRSFNIKLRITCEDKQVIYNNSFISFLWYSGYSFISCTLRADTMEEFRFRMVSYVHLNLFPIAFIVAYFFTGSTNGELIRFKNLYFGKRFRKLQKWVSPVSFSTSLRSVNVTRCLHCMTLWLFNQVHVADKLYINLPPVFRYEW